ncbi:LysR substrate-binding domain-containing protein [Bordetella petrii]|uniref:LysR substrate-binding domain-containing protein n=1 Tax=Bordetella petrii TaxID=94624 RepID=UPI001E3C5E95|nr:LysR substrate-binding domain-containing protein [Bordetella petrii]MCD0505204.1 LysR substrate-binding domain-containing protein [Bordetella petrii]
MKRVPVPLNPLRAFEAAARLLSFTAAAQELSVTQVAISRQVRVLEDYLGVELFTRGPHSIQLTDAGARLYPSVNRAFDEISHAAALVSRRNRPDVLAIQAYTTFAQHGLIPLLSRFHEKHPGIEVRLSASTQAVDFAHQDLDAAIRSGTGHWPDYESDFLAPIELVPVVSPALLKAVGGLDSAGDLRRVTLLHSLARPDDWAAWLAGAGYGSAKGLRVLKFENSAMAYEAAIQGVGCAIGIRALVGRYLDSGALVAPFALTHTLPGGYYLVRPKGRRESPALRIFRAWLLETLVRPPGQAQQ